MDTMDAAFSAARAVGTEIAGRLRLEASSTHVHELNKSVRVICTAGCEIYVSPDGCHLKRLSDGRTITRATLDELAAAVLSVAA